MFNTCGETVTLVANLDNGFSGNGMFGGDGWWAIIIFALIFGWGGNGFGGFGGFGGGREVVNAPCATQADVRAAVDQQTLISKLNQQTYGLADSTRSILDFIVNDKLATLQAENQTLKFQVSQAAQNAFIAANQEAQTAELIRRISPTPVPAYPVPNPNCCYNPFGFGYGNNNNGCGCGC